MRARRPTGAGSGTPRSSLSRATRSARRRSTSGGTSSDRWPGQARGYLIRVTAILTLLGFLGPPSMVLVALGTRRGASASRFWLRVGVVFVIWYGALIGLLYLEPLN